MAIFKSCKDCHAPKRYPGCHDKCLDYLNEKAEYDVRKAIADEKRQRDYDLYAQRSWAVGKALRHKR